MADPDALARRRLQILGLDTPAEPGVARDITVPQVPAQKLPDAQGAEDRYLEAARKNYSLSTPGVVADERAVESAANIRDLPDELEPHPTLYKEAEQALFPQQLRGDRRPSPGELAKSILSMQGRAVVGLADPFGINPVANRARDILTPEEEKGLPTENAILWAFRVLGTAVPAVAQETIERIPAPDAWAAYHDGASKFFTPSTVGEQLFGVKPGELQRVRRTDEGPPVGELPGGADWAEGVLERIEDGRGLEEEFSKAAERRIGPEWKDTAWWLGLGVDALTDWEGALVKGGAVAKGIQRRASDLATIAPDLNVGERLWKALRENEVDISGWVGAKYAKALDDGTMSIDDLPADIRMRADEIALNENDMGFGEVANIEGVGAPRAPGVTDLEHEQRLAAARTKAFEGGVPGHFDPRPEDVTSEAAKLASEGRERLPPFEGKVAPSNAEGVWEQVGDLLKKPDAPKEGYNLIRNEGFRRMIDAADQHPELPEYVLRNRNGDVMARGTFAQTTEKALRRQIDGDQLWWKDQRPVARWRQTGKVKWASDYFFSSPLERTLIRRLREVDPRAIPAKLKGLAKSERTETGSELAGRLLADVMTDAPPGARPRSRTAQIVQQAVGLRMRDRMGSSSFKALPNGVLAVKQDHPRILARAKEVLPIPVERAREMIAGAAPTAAEEKVLGDAARRYGVDRKAGELTTRDWLELRNGAITEAGGVFADARYRMQGTKPFVDRLMQSLGDVALDRRKWNVAEKAFVTRGPLSWLGPRFAEDKMAALPPTVRTVLLRLRTALQRNADDLLQEVKAVKDQPTTAGKLLQVLHRWTPVHPDELALSELARAEGAAQARRVEQTRVWDKGAKKANAAREALETELHDIQAYKGHMERVAAPYKGKPPAEVRAELERLTTREAELQAKVDQLPVAPPAATSAGMDAIRAKWRGPRPAWLDSDDPFDWMHGATHYAKSVSEEAAASGRRWITANLQAAGQDVSKNTLSEAIQKLPVEQARGVYEEAFIRGDLQGPKLQDALKDLNLPPTLPLDKDGALVAYAIQARADNIIGQAMDELINKGIAVRAGDPRKAALHAVVLGEHKVWDEANKRWEFRYPEAQITWALERARDLGIDPGAGSKALPTVTTLGRRAVAIPKYLADDLARMIASAKLDSRALYKTEALNQLVRAFKEWTTHGWILPNPTHFTGQMLSVLPTLITTRGFAGAGSAAATFARHPMIVGGLMKRLAGAEHPVFRSRVPEAELLRTDDGRLLSIEDLEHGARANGLQDTGTAFETAERLKDIIARDSHDYAFLDPRRLTLGLHGWQNLIRKFAGSFDLAARLATYVDLVKKGMPLDEAAQEARKSMLDFRDLTDWEAKNMRMAVLFYAFMRKDADAYVRALFHNPGRVGTQLRLAHAAIKSAGFTPLEMGALTDDDVSRLTVYDDEEVAGSNGRIHPLYRMNRLQSTPLGVGEALQILRMFAGQDPKGLAGTLTPLAQTAAIYLAGRKIDRDYDSAKANRIPPVLMDSTIFPRDLFGIGPVALRERDDPLLADNDATHELGSGEPAVWAAGGDRSLTPEQAARARDRWQLFLTWFGRPVGTMESLAEAAGGIPGFAELGLHEPPPPNLTQQQQTVGTLLGLRWRPAINEQEAVRRGLAERQQEFEDATPAISVPDRANPR